MLWVRDALCPHGIVQPGPLLLGYTQLVMDEITAEYLAPELEAEIELRVIPRVTVAAKTDLGRVRENNEDKHEFFVTEDPGLLARRGLLFVVCDGMGGHEAGQIASELATKTFIDVYLNHPSSQPEPALRDAVKAANRYVHEVSQTVPGRRGMGTTLSAVALVQDRLYGVQVGDSRTYRLREGSLECLTRDHTWVEEVVAAGMMPREEAEKHPYRHMLTRAIGTEPEVTPDIFDTELMVGDLLLLCSDGLLNHVPDPDIERTLLEKAPAAAAWELVNMALRDGGSDNCTVMIVRVDALNPA